MINIEQHIVYQNADLIALATIRHKNPGTWHAEALRRCPDIPRLSWSELTDDLSSYGADIVSVLDRERDSELHDELSLRLNLVTVLLNHLMLLTDYWREVGSVK